MTIFKSSLHTWHTNISLKGKIIRVIPNQLPTRCISIPPPILQHHQNIELHIDYFYVNPIPYLHTKWSNLNFLTVHTGENRTENNIEIGIVCVIKVYEARGFKATSVHGDIEFDLDNVKKEYNQK